MPSTATSILDGLSTSVAVKAPCRTVATSNITLAGLQTISGYTTVENDRVLVKGQTDPVDNGIYMASTGNWTRAKDADGNRDLVQGTLVLVRSAVSDGNLWELTTANPIVIGTSDLTFELRDDPSVTYSQNEDEISAGLTPFNTAYPHGHVLRWATNTTPGTTDMTLAFQRAALTSLAPYAPPGLYLIAGSIPLRDNQHWTLDGARIAITGTSVLVFDIAAGIDDWSINGDWQVTGDNDSAGSLSGSAAALRILDSMRFRVSGLTAKNIRGWGIIVQPGSSTASRAEKGQIVAPQCYGCYIGIEAQAGGGAEYVNISAPNITRCATGMKVAAGNVNVIGGSITDNVDGVSLVNGTNHGHGSFVGTYINHNTVYAVRANGVLNGHFFIGCNIYEGDIWLQDSQGVMFKSCTIDVDNYYFEGSQGCGFVDCALPDAYGNVITNSFNADPSYTIWQNCKKLAGKNDNGSFGNIKGLRVHATSAGIAITPATLASDTTVLLTDAANYSANDNAQTLFDGYDASTGIYTCRGLGDGKVSVSVLLNVANNAADDGLPSLYGYLAKNGTALHQWMAKTRITSTKTIFSFNGVVEMDDGETLRIRLGGTVANNITIGSTETQVLIEGL